MINKLHKFFFLILICFVACNCNDSTPEIQEWIFLIGNEGHDFGRILCLSNNDEIYCSGNFSGTVDFDPGPDTQELTSEKHSESALDRGDGYDCIFNSDGQLVEVMPSDPSESLSNWGGPILALDGEVTYEILETVRTMEVSNQLLFW